MTINLRQQLTSTFFKNFGRVSKLFHSASLITKKTPKLQTILIVGSIFVTAVLLAPLDASAQQATMGSDVREGPKLLNPDSAIKPHFSNVSRIREERFLPYTSGGTSFMGLVARLLGDRATPEFEGMKVRRYMYHIYADKKPVGVAHASSFLHSSNKVDVTVIYGIDGSLKEVKALGLPEIVAKELASGNYLKQFENHLTEDFEIVRGRKGRINSRGDFIKSHKKPAGALSRGYFDKILRSVSFNAAFMDVAYFITKHPDLDNESEKIIAVAAEDGPEAFVRNRKTGEIQRLPSSDEEESKKN